MVKYSRLNFIFYEIEVYNKIEIIIKFNYESREIKTLGMRHLSWAKATNEKSELTYKLKQEFNGAYFESYFHIPSN